VPTLLVALSGVPEDSQRPLFDAFAFVLQDDQLRGEVQVSVTLTDRLFQAIRPARTRTSPPRRAPSSFLPPFC
jgi:hypothetical protein